MEDQKELRKSLLLDFVAMVIKTDKFDLKMISGDASFRKYYRVNDLVFVDAPPQTEKNREFIECASVYSDNNIMVPKVICSDLENGFLCISDLGNVMFSQYHTKENEQKIYQDAVDLAIKISSIKHDFEIYDRAFIERELQIFYDWYVIKHSGMTFSSDELEIWKKTSDILVQNDIEQPQGTMHRDFHCRNIMIYNVDQLAVIDFQDTVTGPVTYDLISLLKDCYVTLDPVFRTLMLQRAFEQLKARFDDAITFEKFVKYAELTAMQRHLKAIGIFCRLFYRDGKDSYFQYLPRTFGYVEETACKYPELAGFAKLLKNKLTKR